MSRKWKWTIAAAVVFIGLNALWLGYVSTFDYTPRAQVSEGLSLAVGTKLAVVEYYGTHGEFPASNAEAGIDYDIDGRFVTDVQIPPGGVIRVTYGGTEADEDIAGRILMLRPAVDEGSGEISWSCDAPEIAAKHIPATCRYWSGELGG